MLSIKPGVDVSGISPEVLLGAIILADVMWKHGIPAVITSCRDGKHMEGSFHYTGKALDFRLPSRFLTTTFIDVVVLNEARGDLGDQYDLVLEESHYHLEYDPGKDLST